MPIPRIIASTVDLHVRYVINETQRAENVFQFKYSSAPTATDLSALGNAIVGDPHKSRLQACLPTNCRLVEVFIKDLATATGLEATVPFPVNTFGTRSSNKVAYNTAVSVTLRTGLAGRSNRGRKSFGPVSGDDITESLASSGLISAIATFIGNLIAIVIASKFTLAVGSAKLGTSRTVNGYIIPDNQLDSQKTRLIGHGT